MSRLALMLAGAMVALLLTACERGPAEVAATPTPTTDIAVVATSTATIAVPTALPTPLPPATSIPPLAISPTPAAPSPSPLVSPTPPEPPVRDLFALAQRYRMVDADGAPLTRTLPPDPNCCEVGHMREFFVTDLIDRRFYTVEARLLAVSENAYWYADVDTELTEQQLERTAAVFEQDIRPPIVDAIGDIWKPGVDGDPHLVVLHTPLRAAAGYFSSSDSYPRSTHPRSNQSEMIVMDGSWLLPGVEPYFSVLAHEFQHAAHWNLDLGEDVWINEGFSEVATQTAGFQASFVDIFMARPEAQLNYWPDEPRDTLPHYGGATLFVEYLMVHYGGAAKLGELAREPLDGVNGVERYLSQYGANFADVFADWTVANYLDGRLDGMALGDDAKSLAKYRYPDRSVQLGGARRVSGDYDISTTQPQLTARYFELRLTSGDAQVDFSGDATVAQVAAKCRSGRYCWWGNNGDSIDSTLTRELDLSGVDAATLEFWMWHDIEEDWDYAYASVSTDGGDTWTTLDGEHTTRHDPLGANYGAGITGISGKGGSGDSANTSESAEWVQERMDLSRYAGMNSMLLRFEYITDEGVNLGGILLDDIAIPEIGFTDDAESDGDWQAHGFRRIDNALPQTFALHIIEFATDGSVSVRHARRNSFTIEGFGSRLNYAVLVVAPTTHQTYQPASYSLRVTAK
ncbi:MAG: immune inhibitor A [Chloroflexi bacterium]|nr:immune inhibitor A [Chloroflexota bacterium]